jgi:hypothetical protein
MCMEDIRIGRKRYVKTTISTTVGAGGSTAVFNADSRRVAILWTTDGAERVDLFPQPTVTGSASVTIGTTAPQLLMRIEDLGSLVMGPWAANNPGAGAVVLRAVEIIYDSEDAPRPGEFR